jgi:FixJ family two-component response regulator
MQRPWRRHDPRERQVVEGIRAGHAIKTIALGPGISPRTPPGAHAEAAQGIQQRRCGLQ